jgi:hypothetical protein
MSGQADGGAVFSRWVHTVLSGSGWSAASVGQAACSPRDDLVTAALADGFAAVQWGLARHGKAEGR